MPRAPPAYLVAAQGQAEPSAHCLPAISLPELARTLTRLSRRRDAPGCGSTHLVREGVVTEGRAPGTRMRLRMGCHPGMHRAAPGRPPRSGAIHTVICSQAMESPAGQAPWGARAAGPPAPALQKPPPASPATIPSLFRPVCLTQGPGAASGLWCTPAHCPTAPPTPLRLAPGAPTLRCGLWKQQLRVQGDGAVQMQPAPARSCTAAAARRHHSSPPQPSA